jgi:DnaA family protein
VRGLSLSDATARYILQRIPRDPASLFAFLDRLDAAALQSQRRITIPFVREALAL